MKQALLLFIITVSLSQLYAQSGVNISPTPIPNDPSAILNVQSQNQGVLLPRSTTGSVMNPSDGLIVFDTVLNHYMFYDQNQWTKLLKASAFSFYYADRDGDGYGDPFSAIYSMTAPIGYVAAGDDCNDSDPLVNSAGEEICSNMLDDNCNGEIDENPDNDNDSYTLCGGDCDDNNALVFPGAPELCDAVDNDCDPFTQDGIEDPSLGNACDGADSDLCAEGVFGCANGILICFEDPSGKIGRAHV